MPKNPFATALLRYLEPADKNYFGKCIELREAIQKWLSYIPHTFPHYTSHTIEHSEEIISQLSQLLFTDDDPQRPSVTLSPTEVYILVAAAYLHDAGMVVSDAEKIDILKSDDWRQWTTSDGNGAKRWLQIEALRHAISLHDGALRDFLADIQVRFLIAEFVRRTHHQNAARLLTQHQATLARFAFDDVMLLRTISDVCVAHGLERHELLDRDRYPEHRTIRGDAVNVRFLAILLRIGDLLDMSNDRACPLLMSAACPLPADSLAHWSQYQRITHRSTTPAKVEITAKCETQEEHILLEDWCQWLSEEVNEAAGIMSHAARHSDWHAPVARLASESPTIIIQPTATAKYIPSRWVFQLDHEAVFERLIHDIDSGRHAFLRELIQNALDAMRCNMYVDLKTAGREQPEYPTEVPEDFRKRYQLRIVLRECKVRNVLSGEDEQRQVLVVEDSGIGMDKEVIQHFFLQVGRSYYTTDEFRRHFRFVPTSRFGVGFLSVFNVSDSVVVETHKPTSPSKDGPLRLVLRGPRNFLLTEKGSRVESGTCIELGLRKNLVPGELTEAVRQLCRRVEFPILVDDLGIKSTIVAEKKNEFTYELPDVTDSRSKFVVNAFPVKGTGIEGEIYILGRVKDGMESWAVWGYSQYAYPKAHPHAVPPEMPQSLVCLHGLAAGRGGRMGGDQCYRYRLDVRSALFHPTLSRHIDPDARTAYAEIQRVVDKTLTTLLTQHMAGCPLANGQDGWIYKQQLADYFSLKQFWASVPGTIRLHFPSGPILLSLDELQHLPVITIATPKGHSGLLTSYDKSPEPTKLIRDSESPVLMHLDIRRLAHNYVETIIESRVPTKVRWLEDMHFAVDWKLSPAEQPFCVHEERYRVFVLPLPDDHMVGVRFEVTSLKRAYLINSQNPLVTWLVALKKECEKESHNLGTRQFDQAVDAFLGAVTYSTEVKAFLDYLQKWRELPSLPPDLRPPVLEKLHFVRGFLSTDPKEDEMSIVWELSRSKTRNRPRQKP